MLSFGSLIILGTFALLIPGMTTKDAGLGFVDAFFTATSAVCVTGLVVVDTGTAFTLPGQLCILTLIQMGGLGIMTFSVFFLRLAGRSSTLRDELAVRSSMSFKPHHDLSELLRSVVLFTLTIEAVGALLLFTFFLGEHPPVRAAYLAVFHAISAFCNAGFALWSDSLSSYKNHIGINLVFIMLIVFGGLGFIVLYELTGLRRRTRRRLSLHTRVVLLTTLVLIAGGTLIFLTLEWNNVMKGQPWWGKFITGLFQSVTTRTAGFNTVDFNHLTNSTLLFTIFLMFIGGSPGSTAGGVKTVPMALLFALAISRYRGYTRVNLFRRTVSNETIARGVTIIMVGIAIITVSLALLLYTQTGTMDHLQTRDIFIELLFETVSAFGTVGLSMGVTAQLTAWGKLIIIGTMFLGRVGPLTVALAMMGRTQADRHYNYGTENIMVG